MIDNDVTGLPMLLSNDPVAPFSRDLVAGVTGEHGVLRAFIDEIGVLRAFIDEIGDRLGKYPSFLGETVYTGNTSMVPKS